MCYPYISGFIFFFFNDTATTEIYTLSLHDALPILIREFEALALMELSVLAERRRHVAAGVVGGASGAPGRTLLNGAALPPKVGARLEPGDVLRIETPGGGGWGPNLFERG